MKIIFLIKLQLPLLTVGGLLLLGLIFSAEPVHSSGPVTPDQCCRCHLAVCEQPATKRYVHAPFKENRCAVCHVKDGMPRVGRQDVDDEAHEEIVWFTKDYQESTDHWFELQPSLASTSVALMAKAGGVNVLEQEVVLPALDHAAPFPLAQGQTEISDLRIVEVKKGVFLSARIVWKTDRITDAQIFYGEGGLSSSTALDHRWATAHEITVTGLAANRNYRFVAVSHDIHGNITMSPQTILSTHDFYSLPVLPSQGVPGQIGLQSRFYQEKGRLFAHMTTSHPVAMRLGRHGEQPLKVKADGPEASRPQAHLELTDAYALTLTVCVSCHPQSKGEHSHPVGIRPKTGMHIPPDYSTLADGRLTCMSCHQAHASDNEFRLTRAKRKDLCLGCHRNFG